MLLYGANVRNWITWYSRRQMRRFCACLCAHVRLYVCRATVQTYNLCAYMCVINYLPAYYGGCTRLTDGFLMDVNETNDRGNNDGKTAENNWVECFPLSSPNFRVFKYSNRNGRFRPDVSVSVVFSTIFNVPPGRPRRSCTRMHSVCVGWKMYRNNFSFDKCFNGKKIK